jgi:hypothetical protein
VESRQELCVSKSRSRDRMNSAARQGILIYTKYLIYKLEIVSDFLHEKKAAKYYLGSGGS